MKTIVSVTPLPVSADTRTFKIATSFARSGYHSIVVEGEKSYLDSARLPFDLHTKKTFSSNKDRASAIQTNAKSENGSVLKEAVKRWIKHLPSPMQKMFLGFLLPYLYFSTKFYRLRKDLPAASLYYLHAPYQFPAVYWLSRARGTPIIYDAHDFYSDVIPTLLGRRLESWCIQKAAAVVTVSEGIAQLIQREFGSQAVVVRNCQDLRLQTKPARGLRQALKLPPDKFLLVTIGQVKPGLAAAEAIRALGNLPEKVHLAFVGKNTDMYQEMVKRYGLQSRVHLVEPVKQDEVVQFIQSADVALILYYPFSSNYINCLPNGFFQSFSAGLPLLYPELPEIKRLAEQYDLGLPIDPQSPESIQGAVMSLLNDGKSLAKHKKNSLAARLELSWEKEEVILYDLVRGVMGEGAVVAS